MFNLPILSSLAEQLTGTVTDEFKKLVQPHSLIAAAIFMALNLVLIFPPLVTLRFQFAVAAAILPTPWQIVVGTLTLVVLGYLINNFGSFFVSIVNGNAVKDSPFVGSVLRTRQQRTFDHLKYIMSPVQKGTTGTANSDVISTAAYRLAFEFPDNREALAPTRLGNILLSAASYTLHQYGVHLDTLWPAMDLVLQKENADLQRRLKENQDAMNFLGSLTILLAIVAVEVMAIQLILQHLWLAVGGPAVILIGAYIAYSAAVQKARTWSRDVRFAFDLYLDTVAGKLGLRSLPVQSFKERKERWEAVSRWLAYGGTQFGESWEQPLLEADWFREPPAEFRFELQYPPTVSVQSRVQIERKETRTRTTEHSFGQVASYLFIITNLDSGEHALTATGVYLIVIDSRFSTILSPMQGRLSSSGPQSGSDIVVGEVLSSNPSILLWPLGNLQPHASCILQYSVRDEVIVEVVPNDISIESFFEKDDRFVLRAQNCGTTQISTKVIVTLPDDTSMPEQAQCNIREDEIEYRPIDFEVGPGSRQVFWTIPEVRMQARFSLRFKYKRHSQ